MSFHILKGNVHDECIDAFEEYVQSYLDQGWQLRGDLVVLEDGRCFQVITKK